MRREPTNEQPSFQTRAAKFIKEHAETAAAYATTALAGVVVTGRELLQNALQERSIENACTVAVPLLERLQQMAWHSDDPRMQRWKKRGLSAAVGAALGTAFVAGAGWGAVVAGGGLLVGNGLKAYNALKERKGKERKGEEKGEERIEYEAPDRNETTIPEGYIPLVDNDTDTDIRDIMGNSHAGAFSPYDLSLKHKLLKVNPISRLPLGGRDSEPYYESYNYQDGLQASTPNAERLRVLKDYRQLDKPPFFEASLDNNRPIREQFSQVLTQLISLANQPYDQRAKQSDFPRGICYAGDVSNKPSYLDNVGNDRYWKNGASSNAFRMKDEKGVFPSEALSAFFEGPTFADCGEVINACVLRAIENLIGTERFNAYFHTPTTPFEISKVIFGRICEGDLRNPLHFLFDHSDEQKTPISEAEVESGDIIHIAGVDRYQFKHLHGYGGGWNVICMGTNDRGEKVYEGFGPKEFSEPLTLSQIQAILIESYNKPRTQATKDLLEHASSEQRDLSDALAHDSVQDISSLPGIVAKVTLNEKFFTEQFLLQDKGMTWATRESVLRQRTQESEPVAFEHAPKENLYSTFDNYDVETQKQKEMIDRAEKFASAIIGSNNEVPLGLVMTGLAGIGKTHLSVAIAREVEGAGKSVLYIDQKRIKDYYQAEALKKGRGAMLTEDEMNQEFDQWLDGVDLVVFDDVNSRFGAGSFFLRRALHHTYRNNKAILVSSNEPVVITESMQTSGVYVPLNSLASRNMLVMRDLDGTSRRSSWWQDKHIDILTLSLDEQIGYVATLKDDSAIGLVVECDTRLAQIEAEYRRNSPDAKIRIVEEPYRDQYIHDADIADAGDYDVFIINVEGDFGEAEQLMRLIAHVHDTGKKIIVRTSNEAKMYNAIEKNLTFPKINPDKKRYEDRLAAILLSKTQQGMSG